MCFLEPVLSGRAGEGKRQERLTGCQGSGTGSGSRSVYLVPPYFPAWRYPVSIWRFSYWRRQPGHVIRRRQLSAPFPFERHPCALCWEAPCGWFWYALYPSRTWRGLMLWRDWRSHGPDGRGPGTLGTQKQSGFTGAWLKAVKNSADKGRSESMALAPYLPSSLPWF